MSDDTVKLQDGQTFNGVVTFNFHDKGYRTDLLQLIKRNVEVLERVEKLLEDNQRAK